MSGHTPEPWRVDKLGDDGRVICGPEGEPIADWTCSSQKYDELGDWVTEPDADRIVACVNACVGINPEAVQELLSACIQARAAMPDPTWSSDEQKPVIALLDSAIAKATGKEGQT